MHQDLSTYLRKKSLNLGIIKGKIVEEGKHEELIFLKKEYYKLYQSQFGNDKKIA